jgi:hypothetical protein
MEFEKFRGDAKPYRAVRNTDFAVDRNTLKIRELSTWVSDLFS